MNYGIVVTEAIAAVRRLGAAKEDSRQRLPIPARTSTPERGGKRVLAC